MIKVMSNSSPIIGLSIINQLHLLCEMFDVYIPHAVYAEIVINRDDGAIGNSKPFLDTLRKNNFRISEKIYEAILKKLNEA